MPRCLIALICVFVLQFSTASCQDKNWKLLGTTTDDIECYVSIKNIIKKKTSAIVWNKFLFDPKSIEKMRLKSRPDLNFEPYNKVIVKKITDFKNNRAKTLSSRYYLNGIIVHELEINEKEAIWYDIIPDSEEDAELVFLKKYLHIKN